MSALPASPALALRRLKPLPARRQPHGDARAEGNGFDVRRLVEEVRAGSEEAFEALYQEFAGPIYSYLLTGTRDPGEAEDVTQEVFIRVYRFVGRFDSKRGDFRAWLFTIARNELRRRIGSRPPVSPGDASELDELEATSPSEIVDRDFLDLVRWLPATQRDAIVLRYMLDLSNPEIARILDRSEMAVRQLQSRALRLLAKRLEPERPPASGRREYGMRRRGCGYRSTVLVGRRRLALVGFG